MDDLVKRLRAISRKADAISERLEKIAAEPAGKPKPAKGAKPPAAKKPAPAAKPAPAKAKPKAAKGAKPKKC